MLYVKKHFKNQKHFLKGLLESIRICFWHFFNAEIIILKAYWNNDFPFSGNLSSSLLCPLPLFLFTFSKKDNSQIMTYVKCMLILVLAQVTLNLDREELLHHTMLEGEKTEDNYWTLCYYWCINFFKEENPFILIIQKHWLKVQLCPMRNLFLTHFSLSKPLYKSASVNFVLFCDIRDTYFNIYILPLGHLGIVKKNPS